MICSYRVVKPSGIRTVSLKYCSIYLYRFTENS